jgi:hypothetical protein
VYINLNGKKASWESLRKEAEEEKKYNLCHQDYIQLSYEKDIIGWIKSSINFIINNNPSDTKMLFLLTEYSEMLERIFNRYKKIMLLLEEEKTLRNVFEISNKVDQIKSDFIRHLKKYIIRTRFIEGIGDNPSFIQNLCDEIGKGLEWETIEGKYITNKGWGFRFYKKEWKPIKIEYKFEKEILENCVICILNYDPQTPENNDWPKMPKKYFNWDDNVFYELVDGNKKGLFSVLKNQIEEMIEKIEANFPNQSPFAAQAQ